MSLKTLVARLPKRLTAAVAMIAAAIIIPVAVFAYGPDRPTYTYAQPADHVTFNSITNNPNIGDERNFVRIKEDKAGTTYGDNITLEPGKVYSMSVYYHNNAAANLNLVAHDSKLRMEVPGVVAPGVNAVLAGNISASNATPGTVWDEVYGKNATTGDIYLRYVTDSATFTSNGAINGQKLPDTLFTTGANLGYNSQDGDVPGCNQYAGYVTFKFRVDQPNFTIKKEVNVGNGWVKNATTQPGSTVQYRISYKNTGTTQQNAVSLRDILPSHTSYVPGSSVVANSSTNAQYAPASDGVTTVGYNLGSYQPDGDAYFKFSAKIDAKEALPCGTTTLKNVARITTAAGYKEDDATVTVNKECAPGTISVCEISTKKLITIKESDFDASKHSKDLSVCVELPHTGTTENIVAIVGLGALIASLVYYIASRRALNQ